MSSSGKELPAAPHIDAWRDGWAQGWLECARWAIGKTAEQIEAEARRRFPELCKDRQ